MIRRIIADYNFGIKLEITNEIDVYVYTRAKVITHNSKTYYSIYIHCNTRNCNIRIIVMQMK